MVPKKSTTFKVKDLRFNDYFYSKLILDNQENKMFLKQDTTKRLIDFQFQKVKYFYWIKFVVYVFFFMIPYCYAIVSG
jgi:hypothetical protein